MSLTVQLSNDMETNTDSSKVNCKKIFCPVAVVVAVAVVAVVVAAAVAAVAVGGHDRPMAPLCQGIDDELI